MNVEESVGKKVDAGTELAADRTALAFSRTDMASDRTLMASVRTSLALIGFGFTIFQFFHTLNEKYLQSQLPNEAPRRFGLTLVVLGVILLTLGILNRRQEAQRLRSRRQNLVSQGLLHHPESTLPSNSMVMAILLLVVGLLAMFSIWFRAGPF